MLLHIMSNSRVCLHQGGIMMKWLFSVPGFRNIRLGDFSVLFEQMVTTVQRFRFTRGDFHLLPALIALARNPSFELDPNEIAQMRVVLKAAIVHIDSPSMWEEFPQHDIADFLVQCGVPPGFPFGDIYSQLKELCFSILPLPDFMESDLRQVLNAKLAVAATVQLPRWPPHDGPPEWYKPVPEWVD
mmetsp:Transcript_70823/g.229653  ORF Transcript_70823/g.229653 Transcript_70823/m.229653 type:complete len:186 (-) Transcript_70823:84-641(-)